MNLWLRLLHVLIASWFRPRHDPATGVSKLAFRVWPHDLDLSLHMNNGRYWTIMDLGRADIMLRTGWWRVVMKHGWMPVVNAGKIRFRRELRLFRAFRLETRFVAWGDSFGVMEHRVVSKARDGSEVLNAIALARVAFYDRKRRSFVRPERVFAEMGAVFVPSPEPSPEVAAFLEAEEALKQAA